MIIIIFVAICEMVLNEGASALTETMVRGDDAAECLTAVSVRVPAVARRVGGARTVDATGHKYAVEAGGMAIVMIPGHGEPPCSSVGEVQSIHHGQVFKRRGRRSGWGCGIGGDDGGAGEVWV